MIALGERGAHLLVHMGQRNQVQSNEIHGNPVQSSAIKCNQWQSSAIKGNQSRTCSALVRAL